MRCLIILLFATCCAVPAVAQTSPSQSAGGGTQGSGSNAVARAPVLYDIAPQRPQGILVDELDTRGTNPDSRPLSFFVLSNLRGRLADVACEAGEIVEQRGLHYARQAAHYHHLADHADDPRQEPIALNVGDSSFPGALVRYMLQSDDGGEEYASLLDQIPYAGFALGDGDMAMDRSELMNLAEGSASAGLPLQAANVQCDPNGNAQPICEALGTAPRGKPWNVINQEDVSVGVVSLIDPAVLREISDSRREGLEFARPSHLIPRLVDAMREQDEVDMVVVLLHLVEDRDRSELFDLASTVPGIDLLITNRPLGADTGAANGTAQNGYVVAPRTGTYIIGTDTGAGRTATIDLQLERDAGYEPWHIESLDTRLWRTDNLDPHPETADRLHEAATKFCDDWGEPLNADLPLTYPYTQSDLATFILNVMRFSTGSEVALVNRETFADNNFFPIEDTLSLGDIHAFLPYNNRMAIIEVEGKVLGALADQLGSRLIAAGMSKEDGKVRVNGRPVQSNRTYKVATHRFLARSGDGILSKSQIKKMRVYAPQGTEHAPPSGRSWPITCDEAPSKRACSAPTGSTQTRAFPICTASFCGSIRARSTPPSTGSTCTTR